MTLTALQLGARSRYSTLAAPSALGVSIGPGGAGEVSISVTALPQSWGDAETQGDADAGPGLLQYGINDLWVTFSAPPATGDFVVSVGETGLNEVQVRAVNDAGRPGAATSRFVAITNTPGSGPIAFTDGFSGGFR